jgi:hypothetical protein
MNGKGIGRKHEEPVHLALTNQLEHEEPVHLALTNQLGHEEPVHLALTNQQEQEVEVCITPQKSTLTWRKIVTV